MQQCHKLCDFFFFFFCMDETRLLINVSNASHINEFFFQNYFISPFTALLQSAVNNIIL